MFIWYYSANENVICPHSFYILLLLSIVWISFRYNILSFSIFASILHFSTIKMFFLNQWNWMRATLRSPNPSVNHFYRFISNPFLHQVRKNGIFFKLSIFEKELTFDWVVLTELFPIYYHPWSDLSIDWDRVHFVLTIFNIR